MDLGLNGLVALANSRAGPTVIVQTQKVFTHVAAS